MSVFYWPLPGALSKDINMLKSEMQLWNYFLCNNVLGQDNLQQKGSNFTLDHRTKAVSFSVLVFSPAVLGFLIE